MCGATKKAPHSLVMVAPLPAFSSEYFGVFLISVLKLDKALTVPKQKLP
jgi:hypothetical protein